jgi:PAS domain S-box-containing protein
VVELATVWRTVDDEEPDVAERFRDLLDFAPDAMIVVGESGRILVANRQVEALLGYEPRELLGQSLEALLPERFRRRHLEHRIAYLEDPRPRAMGANLALFARRKDGGEVPVEISLSPVAESGGTVTVAALRDVTTRRRAEEERERARLAREELLSLLSHDLQNSINVLTLNTELLLRVKPSNETEARMRQYGLVLHRSADTMNRLIRDLLDLQQIEEGRFLIDARPEPVVPLVHEAIEPLRALADQRSVGLAASCADDTGPAICDRVRIEQVLHNLVGNALKFVPEGGQVTVETSMSESRVQFKVSDNGPGIAPDELPYVFDRYWQAPSNALRRGSGLGLYIVKTIVEAHEGRAWAWSAPGGGASFFFTLPAGDAG